MPYQRLKPSQSMRRLQTQWKRTVRVITEDNATAYNAGIRSRIQAIHSDLLSLQMNVLTAETNDQARDRATVLDKNFNEVPQ